MKIKIIDPLCQTISSKLAMNVKTFRTLNSVQKGSGSERQNESPKTKFSEIGKRGLLSTNQTKPNLT